MSVHVQLPISVNRRDRVPLQRQVYDEIRGAILAGRLRAGDRVPATRELAQALDVSRVTVSLAYEQLTAEGYLEATRGAGTFVSTEIPDAFGLTTPPSSGRRPDVPVLLSRYSQRLINRTAPDVPSPGTIDLSLFSPDFDGFPVSLWRRLIAQQLTGTSRHFFHYAPDASGYEPLRNAVAVYVARARGVQCDPGQVLVVSGSQQALDLCARVLVDPGQTVAVEDPGYPGARSVFLAHGARVHATPVDEEGISARRLSEKAKVVYVTPSHQFPTGVSMSLPRRAELLSWAHRRRAVIIEDDYDSEYRYRGAPLPALHSFTTDVPVVYVGTFSKVMLPGLRLGYVIVPPSLMRAFTSAKWSMDTHTSLLDQVALADFIAAGHLQRHVRRMRRLYDQRRRALIAALDRHFGEAVTVLGDNAGMHLLARFRDGVREPEPDKYGVRLVSAARYYHLSKPRNEFVMGFTGISEQILREGVKRLSRWC